MKGTFTSLAVCLFALCAGTWPAVSQAQAQQAETPAAPPRAQAAAIKPPAATNALAEPNTNETTFDNGVKMEVLREANGPKPEPNAIVHIQYIGHLEDGTEFDRSYSRRYPSIYKLSDVIGCWQTGIPEMNVGSKAKFTCPPGSANGKRPVDFIDGDTTLYFTIELIAIIG
jgi:FKBP-type peptidyl-prolyl cis-trans isomerase FkpA